VIFCLRRNVAVVAVTVGSAGSQSPRSVLVVEGASTGRLGYHLKGVGNIMNDDDVCLPDGGDRERKKEEVLTINIDNQHQHQQHSACAVCKKTGTTQSHHLSYNPEIIIDVCVPCHMKIHQHGVGVAPGVQKTLDKVIEEKPELLMPLYTKSVEIDGSNYIVSMKDEKILLHLICPNCQSDGVSWAIYAHPDEPHQLFIRCYNCGFDAKVSNIYREDSNE